MMIPRIAIWASLLACVAPLAAAAGDAAGGAPASAAEAAALAPTLQIRVDLSDAPRQIYRVREVIPVGSGELVLHYPQWLPPYHSARGSIANVAAFEITSNGARVRWERDPLDAYTLRAVPPKGAREVEVSFVYVGAGPGQDQTFGEQGTWSTRDLVDLPFTQVSFYPAGFDIRDIRVSPSVVLPHGWQFATALELASREGDTLQFHETAYSTLVDSPLIAGVNFARHDIGSIEGAPVHFDIVGDAPGDIDASPALLQKYRNVVVQLGRLFGSRHFRHYDLLLVLSRYVPLDNIEYHQSTDNRMQHDYLTSEDQFMPNAYLLPHEMIHSWNGKFMRPRGMVTRDLNTPEDNSLIWVYEGLTQYWAGVLTARSGMWSPLQFRNWLASVDARLEYRTGRSWRSLQDVSRSASLMYVNGDDWHSLRRADDFYPEGVALWLDVDTKIRQLSGGRRSLDDFAHAFFGGHDGAVATHTYAFDDLVGALDAIAAYDWANFLRQRIDYVGDGFPYRGLERSGWKLSFQPRPDGDVRSTYRHSDPAFLPYSLGYKADEAGRVVDVQWDGPAFKAGLVPGMRITHVDGAKYSSSAVADAVTAAAASGGVVKLTVETYGNTLDVAVHYAGGMRIPRLTRVPGAADVLDQIIRPK